MSETSTSLGHSDVELLSSRLCHDGFLKVEKIALRHRLFAGGWSQPLQRELLVKDAAVGVLLYDPVLDRVILVRQFRIGAMGGSASPWLLELVAGMVGPGEEASRVAIREAVEESNCTPTELIKICEYLNSPGTSNEKLTLYCGRVDSGAAGGIHGLAEEHEDIEVVVLDLKEVTQAITSGVINNAMTIIAIQWLQLNKPAVLEIWSVPCIAQT